MGKRETALLDIDVQQGLFERSTPVYQAEAMLDNINFLTNEAHQAGAPVIYIQHSNNKLLKKGNRAWQFHPEIRPEIEDLHIHKLQGNAFVDTLLHDELQARNIHRLLPPEWLRRGVYGRRVWVG